MNKRMDLIDPPARTLNAVPFVLAAVHGGTMIVNRLDFYPEPNDQGLTRLGPSTELLTKGYYDRKCLEPLLRMTELLHEQRGDGLVVIDGGANIGTYTVALARQLEPWDGLVIGFEPQEWVYYALAGNIAINNCINAKVMLAALTAETCSIPVPQFDPRQVGETAGVSLNPLLWNPDLGQDNKTTALVPGVTIDSLRLPRLDLLKLDIEGMELEALTGAKATIARCRPVIYAEVILTRADQIQNLLGPDWDELHIPPMMSFFVHKDDPAGGFSL